MVENLSRWLRSVRPKTAADDDDWAVSSAADDLLESVHRTIDSASGQKAIAHRRSRVVRRWAWVPAGAVACAAVALAVVSGSAPSSPPVAGPSGVAVGPSLPAIRPAAMLLDNYTSCADLLAGLRSQAAAHPRAFGSSGPVMMHPGIADKATPGGLASAAGAPAAPAAGSPSGTSTTNVQEIGVDEPDIVKTDGGRLISITDGVLHVVDAASRKITGTLDLTIYQGAQDAQLLVSGEHALVILGGDSSSGMQYYRADSPASEPTKSSYLFVDLTGQPRVTGSLRASGSYLDARMVGTTIRLVVSSSPAITVPVRRTLTSTRAAQKRAVSQAPLSAWVPQYSVTDGANTTKHSVPCNRISHPGHYTAASMLTIYTLGLTDLAANPDPVSVAADGDTVYASATSLYVASNPDWYCCAEATAKQDTQLHRFDITGSKRPAYLGSGQVSGRLLSQYSLSDYAGSLRVATTSGGSGAAAGESSSVFVLDADTLKVTGQVDGLGKGEQIYAVRFEGPVAYVVTFKQTDPLYVLDLADPSAPKLIGTLKLTGYSDYLHDAGDGRLIGVGQEASARGMVAGLQVSLFDVRNPAQPSRTGHVVLKHSRDENTLDPHAFLYWQPTGLLVVPVTSWTASQSGKVLVLSVSGASLREVGELANPRTRSTSDDGLGIQRSVLVDGALWTVSGSGVQVSDVTTLSRQAWIPFG